jgi:hypothetical protein
MGVGQGGLEFGSNAWIRTNEMGTKMSQHVVGNLKLINGVSIVFGISTQCPLSSLKSCGAFTFNVWWWHLVAFVSHLVW